MGGAEVSIRGAKSTTSISGNIVQISGQQVEISGQPVTISGNIVQISGQQVDISGQPVSVSGNIIQISGQAVVTDSGSVTSVSGNIVQISGQQVDISGQPVSISGNIVQISGQAVVTDSGSVTSVSGNIVQISGEAVTISGDIVQISGQQVEISGQPVTISGDIVFLISGERLIDTNELSNIVAESGIILKSWQGSGNQILPVLAMGIDTTETAPAYRALKVDAEGCIDVITHSGDYVTISGTVFTSVSGNVVKISGEAVKISGQAVKISGETVFISGQVVYLISGERLIDANELSNNAAVSGTVLKSLQGSGNQILPVLAMGIDATADAPAYRVLKVDEDGCLNVSTASGFYVTVSGTVFTSVSGNIVQISGEAVTVSGNIVQISGQTVEISGDIVQISGQAVKISGETVFISGQVVYLISGERLIDANELSNNAAVSGTVLKSWQGSGNQILPVLAMGIDATADAPAYRAIYVDDEGSQFVATHSGDYVVISGTVFTSMSGDAVHISGQAVKISGQAVKISGEVVKISGEAVQISGQQVEISGQPVTISGDIVFLISGERLIDANELSNNAAASGTVLKSLQGSGNQILPVLAMGIDATADAPAYRAIYVDDEGSQFVATHSGDYVTISGTVFTSVSGEIVQVTNMSGQVLNVNMSGLTVSLSGATLITTVSGEIVQVTNMSGQALNVNMSGLTVTLSGATVTADISGQAVTVSGNIVQISGQAVTVSGNKVFVITASGDYVVISGTVFTNVSGNIVQISGQPVTISGDIVYLISGERLIDTNELSNIAAASGIILKSLQGSGNQILPVLAMGIDTTADAPAYRAIYVDDEGSQFVATHSGDYVVISGTVFTSMSGDVVHISGQAVKISGQAVKISGETVFISGQVVFLISGERLIDANELSNNAAVSGTVLKSWQGSGNQILPVLAMGLNILTIEPAYRAIAVDNEGCVYVGTHSGDYLFVSGTVLTNVSGDIVHISGQAVTVSGNIIQISGEAVKISGQAVKISGESVKISGETVFISGQTVYLISGERLIDANELSNNAAVSGTVLKSWQGSGNQILPVLAMGIDATADAPAYRAIYVDDEGSQFVATHSGDYVVISGTVFTSMSGDIVVAKISGEVVKISGEKVFDITRSGDYVVISGTVFTSVSGNVVNISGYPVNISGQTVNLISGNKVSVNTVSGDYVVISGTVGISPPTTVRTISLKTVTGVSGGVVLGSGVITACVLKAWSANTNNIWVGGNTSPFANSGIGMFLAASESIAMDINNFNDIYVFAQVSGEKVATIGIN